MKLFVATTAALVAVTMAAPVEVEERQMEMITMVSKAMLPTSLNKISLDLNRPILEQILFWK